MFAYERDIRSVGELGYFLFRRKRCPRCAGALYRVDVLPEFSSGWERDRLEFEHLHRIREAVRYRCDPCHAYFPLAKLAAKR